VSQSRLALLLVCGALTLGAQTGAALDELLQARRYEELAAKLTQSGELAPEQRKYFEGALALRQNRLDAAERALVEAVNTRNPDLAGQKRQTALTSPQVLNSMYMIATALIKLHQYSRAAYHYDMIDKIWGDNNPDIRASARELGHTVALLKDVPRQTISISGEATLAMSAEGYPIRIGEQKFQAILDTGASYSMISETTAKAWGVTPMAGTISVAGFSAKKFPAMPGVIPELRIGTATLHNVVVMISPDKEAIVKAVLGYPVIAALGRLTFHQDGSLTIGAKSEGAAGGAPLWVGDQSLLISLRTDAAPDGGSPRLFTLDTGAHNTFLTDNYLKEHRKDFSGEPDSMALLFGGGGLRPIPAYKAAKLPLWFGSTLVLLNGPHVLSATQGGEAQNYFGQIGIDVLGTFSSYTLDLVQMRFSISK